MKEKVLQQLWNSQRFTDMPLQSLSGRNFRLRDVGQWNSGDGPDFRLGRILLEEPEDQLGICGDIELHVHEADWLRHGHSEDTGYNAVILHVFLFPAAKPVRLQNGSEPLRFCLRPYLKPAELAPFTAQEQLPCGAQLSWISEKVMGEQLERARREYFEAKTRELMRDWDPDITITKAWQKMLLLNLADGLGISQNRQAMRQLAQLFMQEQQTEGISASETEARLRTISGLFIGDADEDLPSSQMKRSEWDLSASRPGNKPQERIRQLSVFCQSVKAVGRRQLLSRPEHVWEEIGEHSGVGTARRKLLYLTVWLPSVYIIGSLICHAKSQAYAFNQWQNHHFAAPELYQKPFLKAGFPSVLVKHHLGTVYQHRSYCQSGRCQHCDIGHKLGLAGNGR